MTARELEAAEAAKADAAAAQLAPFSVPGLGIGMGAGMSGCDKGDGWDLHKASAKGPWADALCRSQGSKGNNNWGGQYGGSCYNGGKMAGKHGGLLGGAGGGGKDGGRAMLLGGGSRSRRRGARSFRPPGAPCTCRKTRTSRVGSFVHVGMLCAEMG